MIPAHAEDRNNPARHLFGWWTAGTEYFYFGPYSYPEDGTTYDILLKGYSEIGGRYVHGYAGSMPSLREGAYKVGDNKCGDLVTFQGEKHCCFNAARIYKYLVMTYQAGGQYCPNDKTLLPVSKDRIKKIFSKFKYEE
jgi:hypothetical protein